MAAESSAGVAIRRAASAVEDFRWPWMTVIASRSVRTIERLSELPAPFGGEPRTFPDSASAELIKCAHNIFNGTKIGYWNEMWQVSPASRRRWSRTAEDLKIDGVSGRVTS